VHRIKPRPIAREGDRLTLAETVAAGQTGGADAVRQLPLLYGDPGTMVRSESYWKTILHRCKSRISSLSRIPANNDRCYCSSGLRRTALRTGCLPKA